MYPFNTFYNYIVFLKSFSLLSLLNARHKISELMINQEDR
jgi:hypothetical protein